MLSDVQLQHYRSYADDSFELGSGVNIIVGPNASGKTNLLEAILMVCAGTSYRAPDQELIAFQKPWAKITAHTEANQERVVKLQREDTKPSKKFMIDGREQRTLPLNRAIPITLFEPDHLQILSGPPELRRNYIDNLIEQTKAGYKKLRQEYGRIVRQRNALLRQEYGVAQDQLFAWNIRLSEVGSRIVQARADTIKQLNQHVAEVYSKIADTITPITLTYDPGSHVDSYATYLLKKLESRTEFDRQRGFTSCGPHRDDLGISIGGQRAQTAASRGEARTLLLTLKILELQLLEKVWGDKPILLLDDVFSELDGTRRRALTDFLKDHQAFITTTDADVVVQHFMDRCTIIPISKPENKR